MSTLACTLTDSATMLRRNLRRLQRYPSMTLLLVGMPIVFLLLFVYVFGGQLGAGFTGGHGGRGAYLDYVMPGILLITVAAAAQGTAITVAMDMTAGIIDRFRTMAIARASVLTGHVIASVIQALFGLVVVLAVALALALARPGRQDRRDRQQNPHGADLAALPQQRLRAHPDHATRAAPVRRVPALHPRHRSGTRAA